MGFPFYNRKVGVTHDTGCSKCTSGVKGVRLPFDSSESGAETYNKQRWRLKELFHVDFALLLAEGFQENVGGFSLCPPFQNGRKLLGDKAQTFRRLPFSLLLASNCFPRCRL